MQKRPSCNAPCPGMKQDLGQPVSARGGCSWQPLLAGDLRRRAQQAIQAIAADLERPFDTWAICRQDDPTGLRSASLASGRAGVALFFRALSALTGNAAAEQRAWELLDDSIALLAERTMDASLFCGFPGVAWVAELIQDRPGESMDDSNEEVDEFLLELLERGPWNGPYDLVDGLAGIGVYFLERLPLRNARRCLSLLVQRLDEKSGGGTDWPPFPSSLGDPAPPQRPSRVNLGLAHGVPGPIAVLGLIASTGIEQARARRLLMNAFDWLTQQRQGPDQDIAFADCTMSSNSRSAWCYGDPGAAAALLLAGRSVGDRNCQRFAMEVARLSARRRFDRTGVVDAGLCHGTAGLGHLYNRMYQATSDDVMKQAALNWFQRTLALRRAGEGIGGFSTWSFELKREGEWQADPCWLTGSAGIGLALMAGISEIEPVWDRAMLLSGPN